MKLHQRGVDLLLNVQDALEHLDKLHEQDVRRLLEETETILRNLLARDVPARQGTETQGDGN